MSTGQTEERPAKRYSRRRFLGTLGAGAAGAVAIGSGGLPRIAYAESGGGTRADRFERMFRDLDPFAENSPSLREALLAVGKPGGILDANDELAAGPIALIVDPALSVNNPNNTSHTAGATFMGQFMDHDMTFDTTSRLGRSIAPRSATNSRTPAFDLDAVYGGGPTASAQLYDPADPITFRVESGGQFEDLPRAPDHRALIADPRNDEHVILAGLHAAFLLFHNRAVELVRSEGYSDPTDVFARARRLTTWHYQWMILHEFLPLFIGQELVDLIFTQGRRFYQFRGEAFIPVEFQAAAYRFGHSMVRPSYRANLAGDNGGPFFAMIFDPGGSGQSDPVDLRGGARAPRRFVGWQTFFNFGDGEVKPNKRIDTKISTPLFQLPGGAIPGTEGTPTALAQRNLLRHITWGLPSGQDIASAMGAPQLSQVDLSELAEFGQDLDLRTPLWYYVLKEAEMMESGLHLGPVGGRIVGEVIIGLLQTDPASYLSVQPSWTPTIGTGEFTMVDFLTFAGVDPASRGQ